MTDDLKKLRHREFRLWLINSLREWGEYCSVSELIPHSNGFGKILYEHGMAMMQDWAEQDLLIYQQHLRETSQIV